MKDNLKRDSERVKENTYAIVMGKKDFNMMVNGKTTRFMEMEP